MLWYIRSLCLICVAIALVRAQTTTPVTDASTLAPTTDVTDGSTATPVGAVTDASTLAPTTDVTAGSTATPIGAVTDASTLSPTTDVTAGSTATPMGAVTDGSTLSPTTVSRTVDPTTDVTDRSTAIPTGATDPPPSSPTTAMTDIQTTAQPTDGTILPTLSTKDITLECNAENMTVMIPTERVSAGSMKGDDLQFEFSNSSSCKGKDITDNNVIYIVLTTSLVGCGTNRTEDDFEEVYTNRVINSYSDGPISRHYVVDIPLECTYNRTKRVSQWYQLTDYTVDKELKEGGAYHFDFYIYKDYNFTTPYEHYPVRIGLDEKFYFAASVLSVDNSLELSLEDCKATPSDDYNDKPSYTIIEDFEENASEDINITCNEDRNLVGVTMNTFRFIGESDMVYLHCDLLVCGADEERSECDKQCPITDSTSQNARRRRDVSQYDVPSLARKRLTRGPIRVIRSASRNEWSPQISNDDTVQEEYANVFSPWVIAMTLMATVVMALFALMVLVLHKLNKMSGSNKRRRECLEEETLALVDYEE